VELDANAGGRIHTKLVGDLKKDVDFAELLDDDENLVTELLAHEREPHELLVLVAVAHDQMVGVLGESEDSLELGLAAALEAHARILSEFDDLLDDVALLVDLDREYRRVPAGVLIFADRAIESLRYGAIGINIWSGAIFGLASPPWGAFPGSTRGDIQSGSGFVHNTFLFDHPQKSVTSVPFTMSPTPVWFLDHQNLLAVGERLFDHEVEPSVARLARVAWVALRGCGTILLGDGASVVFGDYMTGANHVLPTGGAGRAWSGLSTQDFVRWTTWQRVDRPAAARMAHDTAVFATAEGLDAHARAAAAWEAR